MIHHVVFTFALLNFMFCTLLLVYNPSCLLRRKENGRNLFLICFSALGGVYFKMFFFGHFNPMREKNKMNFPSLQSSTAKLELP